MEEFRIEQTDRLNAKIFKHLSLNQELIFFLNAFCNCGHVQRLWKGHAAMVDFVRDTKLLSNLITHYHHSKERSKAFSLTRSNFAPKLSVSAVIQLIIIPKEIIDEIGKEDKIYRKHKKKYDYEKQSMMLNIYYDNDSDIKKQCENICVNKKESLKYALNKRIIWKMSDEYDELDNEIMDDVLCADLDSDFKSLKLEFRNDIKQEWAIFESLKISLRMVESNKESNQFNDSIIIQVTEDGKIGDLHKIFAQTSDKCVNNEANSLRVRIFLQKDGIAML